MTEPANADRPTALENALRLIAAPGCRIYTSVTCWQNPHRYADARYLADRWCDPCIAAAALAGEPMNLRGSGGSAVAR